MSGFDKEIEIWTNLCLEENRKKTFTKWVFNNNAPCSAAKMAEAGFYFIGNNREPDSVQCFLCKKTLDCWDETDDPWLEHIKHSPHCNFAKKHCAEDALTLEEFIDFRIEAIKSAFKNFYTQKKQDYLDRLRHNNKFI